MFQYISGARQKIDQAIDGMLRQMGKQAAAYAREIVPVDTGQLKASIGSFYRQEDKTVVLYADQPYALAVEYGTTHQAAQPYLRPALLSLRGFKLGASFELGFQTTNGEQPRMDTSDRNARINAAVNRGVVKRTRVRVRRYSPATVTGDRD